MMISVGVLNDGGTGGRSIPVPAGCANVWAGWVVVSFIGFTCWVLVDEFIL